MNQETLSTPNPTQFKKEEKKPKKMRTSDKVWCLLFLVTACFSFKYLFIVKEAIIDQNNVGRHTGLMKEYGARDKQQLAEKFSQYNWPSAYDFWIPTLVAIILGVIEKTLLYFGLNFAKSQLIDQNQKPELMNKKGHKIIENAFESSIYFLSVIIELILLRQTKSLPTYMGGVEGSSIYNLYEGYPMYQLPYGMRTFFFASLGIHILRFGQLLISTQKKNDYYEMLLHHTLTFVLFTGAYLMNIIPTGLMVVYVIDVCNIFTHSSKAFAGTTWKNLCLFCGAVCWFSWFYCRLVCLPIIIYYALFTLVDKIPNIETSAEKSVFTILGVFLSLIVLLSVFWFYLITRMVLKAIREGDQEDIQSEIDENETAGSEIGNEIELQMTGHTKEPFLGINENV